jgi:hypothetical protein
MAEGIQRAGEWELLECKLLTSTGLDHDLLPHMLGITLYENIYQACMSGTLMMHNSFSLSNIAPIIGQEFISVKFRTPTMDDDNAKLDFTENVFHTRGVAKREVLDESEFIALDFVSTELMRNLRIRVSEAFDGSVSSIVSKMLKRVKCEKDRYIEPTNGRIRYIAPNLRPFGVIQKILPRAISGTSSQKSPSPVFLFWESTKGMHFRTIDSCIAQQPRWKYTNIAMDRTSPVPPTILDGLSAIRGLALKTNDSMMDMATGVLNSTLITHNTHTKSFTKTQYNYLDAFESEQHIGDGHPLYNTSGHAIEDKGKGRISDGTGKIFLSSTVEEKNTFFDPSYTDSSGNYSFVGYKPYTWLQRQHSQQQQLTEAIKININVMGNTVVSAGDIVTVDLPKRQIDKVQGERDKFDTFVQGDFLVKAIKHKFIIGQDHTMAIELVRDSVAVKYDEIETSIEPRPANTGHEFNDIYVIES